MGTIELAIPKVKPGTYVPSLLQPRRRAEHALLAVVQEAYVHGVSTRKVDDLVKALGVDGISKSEVSRICGELDTVVAAFPDAPVDGGASVSLGGCDVPQGPRGRAGSQSGHGGGGRRDERGGSPGAGRRRGALGRPGLLDGLLAQLGEAGADGRAPWSSPMRTKASSRRSAPC